MLKKPYWDREETLPSTSYSNSFFYLAYVLSPGALAPCVEAPGQFRRAAYESPASLLTTEKTQQLWKPPASNKMATKAI